MIHVFDRFLELIQSGNSILLYVLVLVVALIIVGVNMFKNSLLKEWSYESIVAVPSAFQRLPLVQKWFDATRGLHYATVPDHKLSVKEFLNAPLPTHANRDNLFSGWAFCHFFEHFILAFLCPKLVYLNFIIGIGWEIIESVVHAHDILDIFWNMCGTVMGLLVRAVVLA